MKTLYTTTMINTGGRDGGRSQAADGSFSVAIQPPGSGTDAGATNPEQLFAAGYSACFNSAIALVLKNERKAYTRSQVTATVDLHEDPADGFFISARLQVKIDDWPQAENQRIADLAHQVCPYSKAIRGNVTVAVEGSR